MTVYSVKVTQETIACPYCGLEYRAEGIILDNQLLDGGNILFTCDGRYRPDPRLSSILRDSCLKQFVIEVERTYTISVTPLSS